MEADLAFRGIDFRDYWLPGGGPSRLSVRRLWVLVLALPWDSATHTALRAEREHAERDRLTSRRDYYAAKRAEQEATS